MPKSSFASDLISGLSGSIGTVGYSFNSNTPNLANISLADSITKYLIDNTKILVSYTGSFPNGSPDVLTDSMSITGKVAPPFGTTLETWARSLESNIVSGMFISKGSAGVIPISPAPAYIPGLIIPSLYSILGDYNKSAQQLAWESICDNILQWLNSIVPPSFPSSHSGSVGVSVCTKVNVV